MKMRYTVKSIRIKSNWFDDLGRKQNVYDRITYKGLNLYFQLYKFRLHNQENEHTFSTSISFLRKETGYSTEEIFDLLKKLKGVKVIKVENVSRWEYLLDENGNVRDKDILLITAIDTFPLSDYKKEESNFYIYIPFDLFEVYESKGLNEKYFALYCLIKKWSQNKEHKMYMSIKNMAAILGFHKDYINQMIYEMNRHYFMSSYRKKRSSDSGYFFEHHILDSIKKEYVEKFLFSHKDNIEKLIKRVNKKKNRKKGIDIENELEVIEEVQEEKPLAFGTRKAQVNDSWGESNPFDNVPSGYKTLGSVEDDEEIDVENDELIEELFG